MIWPFDNLRSAWRAVRESAPAAPLPPTMLTQHFSVAEAGCRDGSPLPRELYGNAREVALELEVLRVAVGRPIRCDSWWRSATHNAHVGSNETSQHRLARAVDIVVAGMTPAELHAVVIRLIADGKMRQGGVGYYPPLDATATRRARRGFVHYDCRGTRARWQG